MTNALSGNNGKHNHDTYCIVYNAVKGNIASY